MNDRMRRLLEQDEDQDIATREEQHPTRKPTKPNPAQDRRQNEKEWGRAMAKYHRDRSKSEPGLRKP